MILLPNFVTGPKEFRAICDVCEDAEFARSEDRVKLEKHLAIHAEGCGWMYVAPSKLVCNICQMIEGRKANAKA